MCKAVLVRMDGDLHAALKELARVEDRSVNKTVIRLVRDAVRRQARSAAAAPAGNGKREARAEVQT